jgi:hypothetical protein
MSETCAGQGPEAGQGQHISTTPSHSLPLTMRQGARDVLTAGPATGGLVPQAQPARCDIRPLATGHPGMLATAQAASTIHRMHHRMFCALHTMPLMHTRFNAAATAALPHLSVHHFYMSYSAVASAVAHTASSFPCFISIRQHLPVKHKPHEGHASSEQHQQQHHSPQWGRCPRGPSSPASHPAGSLRRREPLRCPLHGLRPEGHRRGHSQESAILQ